MHIDHDAYRSLYRDGLLGADSAAQRRRILRAWTSSVEELLSEVRPLRHREPHPHRRTTGGDSEAAQWYRDALYALYAISRTSDFLIELGCPAGTPTPSLGETGGRAVDHAELAVREWFLDRIGLDRFEHGETFSPFHHEVFAVSTDETVRTVEVRKVLWPGFRFGDLLFSRAGVHVCAPSRLIDAAVATSSTLYFTHRRAPRKTHDLAAGWGSNSQWRTRFDRFYEDAGGLHLNWDGETYLGDGFVASPEDEEYHGSLERRRELLLHRCFVTAPLPSDEWDRFPFSDRLSIRSGGWPLDRDAVLPDPGALGG